MRKIVVYILTLMLVAAACTSIDCPVQNKVSTLYVLHKANGNADTLKVDTLFVTIERADGSDSLLLNGITGVSSFELPISHTQPEDVFCLTLCDTLGNEYEDTIWVKKEDYAHFESVDCHATYFHKITDIRHTDNIIESVDINNSNVNYDAKTEHFHIVFKARY